MHAFRSLGPVEHVLGLARFAKLTEEPGVIQAFYAGPEGTGI